MQKSFRNTAWSLIGAAALAGCAGTGNPLKGPTTFRYDHVANAHQVRLATPLQVPHAGGQVSIIDPVDPKGFWAIFVVCNLDVNGDAFDYRARNFQVEHRRERFGPLKSQSVRYGGGQELNQPAETPALADAIARELQIGPDSRHLANGTYRSLNYRVAVFVSHGLAAYAGEPLTLSYAGQDAIVVGGEHIPADIPVAGDGKGQLRSKCRS